MKKIIYTLLAVLFLSVIFFGIASAQYQNLSGNFNYSGNVLVQKNFGIGVPTLTSKFEAHGHNGSADAFNRLGYFDYSNGIRGSVFGYVCDTSKPTYHHAEIYLASSSDAGFGDSTTFFSLGNSFQQDSVFTSLIIGEHDFEFDAVGYSSAVKLVLDTNSFKVSDAVSDFFLIDKLTGNVGIGTSSPTTTLEVGGNITSLTIHLSSVPTYTTDALAITGGLVSGDIYKTTVAGSTFLKIVP